MHAYIDLLAKLYVINGWINPCDKKANTAASGPSSTRCFITTYMYKRQFQKVL